MAQVVLHGTRCLQHHGRATALMVPTGAIQITIFVSCLGATWEQNVPPKCRPWCLRVQLTCTTVMTLAFRLPTVAKTIWTGTAPMTTGYPAGQQGQIASMGGQMFAIVYIKARIYQNCCMKI